jgi:hypothetical protein
MVTSCIFSGYVNLKEKKAEISIQIDPEYVYICLRFITALFLPETKGLLIHASSIVHDDTAYLFIGKSNAGKTTMTDLSPDKNILCDDFSIVMNINGKFTVFPSPFWGTLTVDGNNDGRSYPLKAMYLLYQSDENFIRPFSSWLHKIHALHPQILVFANLPQHSKKVFDLENELIEKTKMSKLHFSLDGLVWRCIEDEEDAICKR